MKQEEVSIVCDGCRPPRSSAVITCEVHSVDLCEYHMRKHFERASCQLVPVDREPTTMERNFDQLEALGQLLGPSIDAMKQSPGQADDTMLQQERGREDEGSASFYLTINGVPAC